MNDFTACLESSHKAADASWWEECYRQAFPTMQAFVDHRQNGDHQKAGIDRSIVLENGKQIWIDEKVRWRNKITNIVYDDIALEEWSIENKTPGWVVKPLLCDYIAYAIAPLGKCYLFPVIQLQTAWKQHANEWKQKAGKAIIAENKNYKTISWAVQPAELFKAIGSCLRVSFQPTEE